MKHYIIVKFNELATDRDALFSDIFALFKQAETLPGIHKVSLHQACIHSEIRYDLMIILDMEKEALSFFDASFIHREWKANFANYLAHKVIFDCED